MLAIPLKKTSRWLPIVFCLLIVLYLGYVYSLIRSTPDVLLAAVSLGGEPVQRFVAKRELLRRVRTSESSGIDALSTSIGMYGRGYIDSDATLELATELIENGVDVNGQTATGFTPLHTAINLMQPDSVAFLLENCADPGVPISFGPDSEVTYMNALEMAYFMEREFPDKDYSGVIEVLERSNIGTKCDASR
jgi:hypothetical protein